ncbi:hypothetical protein [Paraliomyxa miuraensis]|uniref:hypothetical protein n=1 Tax=Paraliomyxa miuraensis TaxID=376150 RepID=UPI002258814A|nr:hypothetical protein [Paraliomyxa miuraensis]MCX4243656.1 hypothetical protein [Paraliomyxa miuraensis]
MTRRSTDATAEVTTRGAGRRGSLLLRWVLGSSLVGWVLGTVSGDAVIAAFRSVNPLLYGAFCVGFALLNLLLDGVAAVPTHRHAAPDLRLREYLVVRGAAHLGGAINVHLGQAQVGSLLVRVYGAGLTDVLATTLICYGTTLGALLLLGAIPLLSWDAPAWLSTGILGGLTAAVAYGAALLWPPRALARLPVFAQLRQIGVTTQLRLLVLRLPTVMLHMLGIWVAYAFFGIRLALDDAVVVIPLLTVVSAVPLVPHGIGARDLAALSLLGAAAGPQQLANLVSAGVALAAGSTLAQVVVGLAFMPALERLRARRTAL